MEMIVFSIDKKSSKPLPPFDSYDVIVSTKLNFIGLTLKNEIVAQHHKPLYSFRFKPENLYFFNYIKLLKSKGKIDKVFLENYFNENNDNPFSIQLILDLMFKGIDINKNTVITQFPPLRLKKDINEVKIKFQNLIDNAKPTDQIFMFDRSSRVAQKIREIDFSPWSHVALINNDKIVNDMTTGGIVTYPISDLDPIKYDLALYRINDIESLPKEYFDNIIKRMDYILRKNPKYDWNGIMRAYLFRKFKSLRFIRKKTDKTLSDMIFSNKLRLIAEV
jgi:hypothetical protein